MKKQSFSIDFQELERIINNLETKDVDLDDGMKEYEKGLKLAKSLKKYLEEEENLVKVLNKAK